MRYLGALLVGVGLAATLGPGAPVAAGGGSPLRREPRLNARITLAHREIYLGELVEQIGVRTGVSLAVSDRQGPVSGYRTTLIVRNRPAVEVLEAFAALYGTRTDRWFWAKSGAGFELRPEASPQALPESWERLGVRVLLDEQAQMKAFYALHPEGRARALARDPSLAPLGTPLRERTFPLVAGLSPSQIEALAERRPIRIPVASLTHAQRGALGDGQKNARSVTLFGMTSPAPAIFFQAGGGGGPAILGGRTAQARLFRLAQDAWVLPGDQRTPLGGRVPQRETPEAQRDLAGGYAPLARAVELLARHADVDVLLDHHGVDNDSAMLDLRGALGVVLGRLDAARMMWKRRGSLYLFRPKEYPRYSRIMLVGWPSISGWRRAATEGDGFLGVRQWAEVAGLNESQVARIRDEFPDVETAAACRSVLAVEPLLDAVARQRGRSPEGLRWADLSDTARAAVTRALARRPDAARFRLIWEFPSPSAPGRAYLGDAESPQPRVFQRRRCVPRNTAIPL
jgi:hypothetical protein